MKNKCFFTSCNHEVNERGKFCEFHDKKEREAFFEIASMLKNMEDKMMMYEVNFEQKCMDCGSTFFDKKN